MHDYHCEYCRSDPTYYCYYDGADYCDGYLVTEEEIQDGVCEACKTSRMNKPNLRNNDPLNVEQLLAEFWERNSVERLKAENDRLRAELASRPATDPLQTLDGYQAVAMETARFGPVQHNSIPAFIACFESMGRVAERAKKAFRDRGGLFNDGDLTIINDSFRTISRAGAEAYRMVRKEQEKEQYPGSPLIYPLLGLIGESGEVAGKMYKVALGEELTDNDRFELVKELGDVTWYIAALSRLLGADLSDVAGINIDKLRDRKSRKMIHGEGDNR